MIGVLIFPDFQLLDAAGPISTFEIAMRFAVGGPEVHGAGGIGAEGGGLPAGESYQRENQEHGCSIRTPERIPCNCA